ncbi:MAG: pantetheine-phosphate adenylyltransferase [Bacteroidia bacterium]|nr:pantetheine-phosphate adenylyltransferase [Bacteroidia bacterium]MCC6768380.1 pantetheine-phosphate adenylyltransferase [Bacteroidia bacterium]
MKRTAVFPGSFDPFTIGHESIVRRSLSLFDEVVVAVGKNSTKATLYSLEQRVEWVKNIFQDEPRVSADLFDGLTVTYCKNKNLRFILRGLRTSGDFEFERGIATINRAMESDIETVFILSLPEHSAISSTIIREIVKSGGDASQFVPGAVKL